METYKGIPAFHAKNRQAWRAWLKKHHAKEKSVWLIIYRKESSTPSVYYPEAVDEALCFGWIDSKPNKRDEESYYQFFSQRNPNSNWSKVNKEKVAVLLEQGLMQPSGLEMIELAKKSGTWTALDEVEAGVLPKELKALFAKNKVAFAHWEAFPKSSKRGILEWILSAKKPETRQKRIEETVRLAEKNIKANYPVISMPNKKPTQSTSTIIHFRQNIQRLAPSKGGYYYLTVSADTVATWSKGRHTRLRCVLDEKLELRSGLNHLGNGDYFIIVATRYLKSLRKTAGDAVTFTLEEDPNPLGVEIPEVLSALLEQDEDLKTVFEGMTDGKKRSLIFFISGVRDIDKQVQKAIAFLNDVKAGRSIMKKK